MSDERTFNGSNVSLKVVKTEMKDSGESLQIVRPVVNTTKSSDQIVGELVNRFDYKTNEVRASGGELNAVQQAFGTNLAKELIKTYDGSNLVSDSQQDLIGEKYLAEQIKIIQEQQRTTSILDKWSHLLYEGEKGYAKSSSKKNDQTAATTEAEVETTQDEREEEVEGEEEEETTTANNNEMQDRQEEYERQEQEEDDDDQEQDEEREEEEDETRADQQQTTCVDATESQFSFVMHQTNDQMLSTQVSQLALSQSGNLVKSNSQAKQKLQQQKQEKNETTTQSGDYNEDNEDKDEEEEEEEGEEEDEEEEENEEGVEREKVDVVEMTEVEREETTMGENEVEDEDDEDEDEQKEEEEEIDQELNELTNEVTEVEVDNAKEPSQLGITLDQSAVTMNTTIKQEDETTTPSQQQSDENNSNNTKINKSNRTNNYDNNTTMNNSTATSTATQQKKTKKRSNSMLKDEQIKRHARKLREQQESQKSQGEFRGTESRVRTDARGGAGCASGHQYANNSHNQFGGSGFSSSAAGSSAYEPDFSSQDQAMNSVTIDAYNSPQFKQMLEELTKPMNIPPEQVNFPPEWPAQDRINMLAEPIYIPAPQPVVIPAPNILNMTQATCGNNGTTNSNIDEDTMKPSVSLYPTIESDQQYMKNFGVRQLSMNP